MSLKAYLLKVLAQIFSVSESQLHMVNFLTLKTTIPEVNKAIQDSQNRQNLFIFKIYLIPAILRALVSYIGFFNGF